MAEEHASATAEYGEAEMMDMSDEMIKDFPFKNTWYELTIKRLIRYAADNGFDSISIPKGSVIQNRYNLTTKIDDFEIGSFDLKRKEVGLEAKDKNGILQISEVYSFDKVEKEFGKNILDKIIKKGKRIDWSKVDEPGIPETRVLLENTIEIGGEGKTKLYNQAIPAFIKKYGKKWNAKVYDDKIQIDKKTMGSYLGNISEEQAKGMPVTIIEITDEMRKSVQGTPQPLFEIFGGVGLSYWGSQAVKDNMQNNIISNTTKN